MTVNSTANRVSHTGNGVTTAFAFPYYFQMAADLVVLETVIATGAQAVRALTTDYTVTGTQDANGFFPNGGTINANVAPASTVTWTIYRDPARTQLTQHVDGDSMPAASIDGPLDKLTMIAQRHDDVLARSLRQPDGDTANISTIPAKVTRANGGLGSYAGYDANGDATTYTPPGQGVAVSVAMAPVVTAASLVGAFAALAPGVPLLTADATPDAAADLLTSYDNDAAAARAVRPVDFLGAALGFVLLNGDLVASVAASALTIAIKTTAGNDPSAADPVYVVFRNATLTSGTKAVLKITAATSLVVPSTATLGTVNSTPFRLWVVGFNDGGTFRLGVINNVSGTDIFPLRDGIQSATNPVGSSAQTIYANASVTAKAMRMLGYMDWQSGLATAGTWSAGPDVIQPFHSGIALPGTVVQSVISETGAVATGTTTMPVNNTTPTSAQGDQYMSKAVTPVAKMNVLDIDVNAFFATSIAGVAQIQMSLLQDAGASALSSAITSQPAAGSPVPLRLRHKMAAGIAAATTFKVRAGGGAAGTTTFNGAAGTQIGNGTMASSAAISELMA